MLLLARVCDACEGAVVFHRCCNVTVDVAVGACVAAAVFVPLLLNVVSVSALSTFFRTATLVVFVVVFFFLGTVGHAAAVAAAAADAAAAAAAAIDAFVVVGVALGIKLCHRRCRDLAIQRGQWKRAEPLIETKGFECTSMQLRFSLIVFRCRGGGSVPSDALNKGSWPLWPYHMLYCMVF